MYLPKWIVVLLFTTSIASLGTLLVVFLRSEPAAISENVEPEATIVVATSPESTNQSSVKEEGVEARTGGAQAVMASDEWKTHTQKELDISVDIPKSWVATYENDTLLLSDPTSLEKSVTLFRSKKEKSSENIDSVKKSKAEILEKDASIKMNGSPADLTVFDYKAVAFAYSRKEVTTKEVLFVTRNYVYSLTFVPDSEETSMLYNEVLKSVKII